MAAAFAAVVSSVQAETIAEIAAGNPDLSLLVEVLQEFAPELLDAASSEDAELTVFAPNNDAFAGLLTSLDVELSELDPMLVKSILEAHVINKVVLSTDLSDGLTVESIGGYPLTFTLQSAGGGAFVNDVWIYPKNAFVCGTNPFEPVCVEILNTDIIADNGVIHVINGTPVIAQTEMTPQLATDPRAEHVPYIRAGVIFADDIVPAEEAPAEEAPAEEAPAEEAPAPGPAPAN